MVNLAFVLWGVFTTLFLFGILDGSAQTYTLNQVYERTLQKNEEIRISQEDLRHSRQERRRVFSAVLPKITLTGTYDRTPEKLSGFGVIQPEEAYGIEAKVEQPLYSGGKNRAGIRIAEQGIEVAQRNLNLSSEGVILRTAQAFYGVLKAQRSLEAQRKNVERLREHRRLSELRYKVGEVTEAILLRAAAELAGAEAELVVSENELVVQKRELQILADIPDGFEILDPPIPEVPSEARPQLFEMAFSKREELLRSQIQEGIAKERVSFARGNFLPSLNLEGTYFNRDQEPRSTFFIEDSWKVGARIEFPIFEGGLRLAELAQARSQLEQNRLETARLKKQIDLDVTRSSQTLEAVTKALNSRQEQLRFATKNYEIVSKQFTFGLASQVDLLDANQLLIEAERDVIAATYDQHLSILDLQRSVGVLLTKVVDTHGQSRGTY